LAGRFGLSGETRNKGARIEREIVRALSADFRGSTPCKTNCPCTSADGVERGQGAGAVAGQRHDVLSTPVWLRANASPLHIVKIAAIILTISIVFGVVYPGVAAYYSGMFFERDVKKSISLNPRLQAKERLQL
jgi:hypothetical protein